MLADKVSGDLAGVWLLVAEHLRLGTWDLLCGWTGQPGERVEPRLALQCVHEAAVCTAGIRAERTLEAAIASAVPPVLLVGVRNAPSPAASRSDLRAQEYLPGRNRRRFDAHLRFVTGEVIPWADERFGPVAGPWIAAGFSNGAAWAIAAAQRRPDLIGSVAALSAGVVPQRISGAAHSAGIRHYLAAGTLEPGFRQSTRRWAERLARAGLGYRHEEWIGGHDQEWWKQQLPRRAGLAAPGSTWSN